MEDAPKRMNGVWKWGRWLLPAVLGVLVGLKLFVIDIYTIPQQGMVPSIAPGARFLGWKRPYRDPAQVRRGDVIMFTRRLPDGKTYQFVWRVIGLPGDRVEIAGDVVRVNGQELTREQVRLQDGLAVYREHNGGVTYEVAYPSSPAATATLPPDVALTVPPGEFFLLGDNRHYARDSRYDGAVPFGAITAKRL